MTRRGTLRVYLGAAPGVGKTYAMLDEGRRRAARGADVVVAVAETHGRVHTAERLETLEQVPRRQVTYRGSTFPELDLAAVLARAPHLALVDELAHTVVPGAGPHEKRWQDVETLLEAGIDVISTVNVQHLESLNDVVEAITGVTQRETVPDGVVRAADQVELVDMTPEALRRRMAHGNVYPAEKVDAALANYFRAGNLTALRELALLWLADQVDEGLQRYREQHGITATWETRERVVVALTGGPEGEALVRRGARIAARVSGGELAVVHVTRGDGLATDRHLDTEALARQRRLAESLGGSYHSIVGDDVPRALLEFARAVDATQIVLGASRRRPWVAAFGGPGTGATVTRLSGSIDVHMVSHDFVPGRPGARGRPGRLGGSLPRRRQLLGAVVGAVLLVGLTLLGTTARAGVGLASDSLLYLLAVVITAAIGGFWPALVAAVAGSVLLNWYFSEPLHTLTIASAENVLGLVVFLAVAVMVSRLVDVAARRTTDARRAAVEADTVRNFVLSMLATNSLTDLLGTVRETFAADGAALLRRAGSAPDSSGRGVAWQQVAASGAGAPDRPEGSAASVAVDDDLVLALAGTPLSGTDQRTLSALGAQLGIAYRQGQLREAALAAAPLAANDRARTALLNAVSHDLRTPIAAVKTAVSSLQAADVTWSPADEAELLATAQTGLDRLTDLVTNLLDMSRLQAGLMPALIEPVGLDDVVARALDHVEGSDHVVVDLPDDLPLVAADPGLLERVVANVVGNGLRYAPTDRPLHLLAVTAGARVQLSVVDGGPGIADADVDSVFDAFQRRGDRPTDGAGVGLGLAIARGFMEAMAGSITVETTPGGGTTMVLTLPVATPDRGGDRPPRPATPDAAEAAAPVPAPVPAPVATRSDGPRVTA